MDENGTKCQIENFLGYHVWLIYHLLIRYVISQLNLWRLLDIDDASIKYQYTKAIWWRKCMCTRWQITMIDTRLLNVPHIITNLVPNYTYNLHVIWSLINCMVVIDLERVVYYSMFFLHWWTLCKHACIKIEVP